MQATLPSPDATALAHSERLHAHIVRDIQQSGPISFARYMQLALYAPGLGYYSAGAQKFGEAGDFITAPDMSPLFSRCVARQCEQILAHLPEGDILELGAGSGAMAAEMLQTLAQSKTLPAHYYILEVSADLKDRQQTFLKQTLSSELFSHVVWLDRLPEQPINGVIVANEVMDAMPVHKFVQQEGVKEYYVTYKDEQMQWHIDQPSSPELTQRVSSLNIDFSEHYESEINLLLAPWIASLSDCLERGLILLIDYGFPRHEYYHHDRTMGTIMCHYRHHAHSDPLMYPGIQDITAHVDFTAIAEAAVENQLDVVGFTHQAGLLMNLGITDLLAEVQQQQDTVTQFNIQQQIKRLTLPSEMGELFKAIALTRDIDEPLWGFAMMNQLERL